jgi:hypothetical protein
MAGKAQGQASDGWQQGSAAFLAASLTAGSAT